MKLNKYDLYERSVQSSETHVSWFTQLYRDLHRKDPRAFREDFCGTFQVSCEWVRRSPKNTALGLDLDPEPLKYGKKKNLSQLTLEQRKRVKVLQADVLTPPPFKQDMIYAGNFSFFVFKKRTELLIYFQSCLKSLRTHGTLILELAGGPGMIAPGKERKKVALGSGKSFVYIWDQKDFNPIQNHAQYSISFKLPNGTILKDAFEYDWRVWTIPETREVLAEAGFSQSYVYWETVHRGKGTGEFIRAEFADNAYSWVAYILAVR